MAHKKAQRIFLACTAIFLILYIFKPVNIVLLRFHDPSLTSLMKYRIKSAEKSGKKLRIKKRWVKLKDISPHLIRAVILAEDARFFEHSGFDMEGIKHAIYVNIRKKRFVKGGSTISQQVAKNLFLNPRKSVLRKLHEAILTVELEAFLPKKRILEIYLNVAEWGDGIFGAEAASLHYFKKHASDLTPEEALRLAAVLPNPLRYSPTGNSRFLLRRLSILRKSFYRTSPDL